MDISKYRKQTEERVKRAGEKARRQRDSVLRSASPAARSTARARSAGKTSDAAIAIEIALDRSKSVKIRLQALEIVSKTVTRDEGLFKSVLALLANGRQPRLIRERVLQMLQAASFRSASFAPYRADYLRALRVLIDDADRSLRERALDILSLERDEYAQRRLLDGLASESQAIVPPEKAVQLLGEDFHADHLPLLERIVKDSKSSSAARREALRLMGAHPSSSPTLSRVLKDKREDPNVRRESALSLQTLAPDQFERLAKRIAVDGAEDADLRATMLTALALFGYPADAKFAQHVRKVKDSARGANLRRAAGRLLKEDADS